MSSTKDSTSTKQARDPITAGRTNTLTAPNPNTGEGPSTKKASGPIACDHKNNETEPKCDDMCEHELLQVPHTNMHEAVM